MKKLTNNQVLIREFVDQAFREENPYSDVNKYFEFFSADQILKEYELSDEEIERGIIGGGHDGGCDSVYLFLNGNLVSEDFSLTDQLPKEAKLDLFIIQSKYTSSFDETTIMKWKTLSNNIFEIDNNLKKFTNRYSRQLISFFQLFRDLFIKLIRSKMKLNVCFCYATYGIEIHPNVILQANELEDLVKEFFPNSNNSACVKFYGANEIMGLINRTKRTTYSIRLSETPITLGEKKDYVSLINLSEYYKLITDEDGEINKCIFEANVRDYQGSVTVNVGIQETLKNSNDEDFWWLNNGVTILASDAHMAVGKEIVIELPEIVNGLQTSSEIFNYFSMNPKALIEEKRNVLVRIIVPESEETRDRIILSTNSQTNIPKASLRATDTIHRQIEMYFRSRGLFYDRRKNYYKNQGRKANEIISISFLAQCMMTLLLHKPDYARARPSTLLSNDEEYGKLYSQSHSLSVFYNAAKIGRNIETNLKKHVEFTPVERGDILFYVLFSVVVNTVGHVDLQATDLADFDIDFLQSKVIDEQIEWVYSLYKVLGGTGKIAKGPKLIRKIKEELASKYLLENSYPNKP